VCILLAPARCRGVGPSHCGHLDNRSSCSSTLMIGDLLRYWHSEGEETGTRREGFVPERGLFGGRLSFFLFLFIDPTPPAAVVSSGWRLYRGTREAFFFGGDKLGGRDCSTLTKGAEGCRFNPLPVAQIHTGGCWDGTVPCGVSALLPDRLNCALLSWMQHILWDLGPMTFLIWAFATRWQDVEVQSFLFGLLAVPLFPASKRLL